MKAMISFKRLLGLCALRTRRQPSMVAVLARLSLPLLALLSLAVEAQTTFTYTNAVAPQTYTVPVGAGGVQIQAAGAGGGSGGNDLNGRGGAGGAGARATGTYYAAPGTVLNIYVGQGGRSGNTSKGAYNYTNAAGAGGLAGGAAGFSGGAGGRPGSGGWSGGGAGGGAASVVATVANVPLVIAGGGGGGQGAALNVAGRAGIDAPATPIGALPGAAGSAGTTNSKDGGGGGGGGGGCPSGAGGAVLLDSSGPTNITPQAGGGSSCRDTSQVTSFVVTGAAGGAAGLSSSVTTDPPGSGTPGGSGSVIITPLYPTLNLAKSQPSPALAVGGNSGYTLTVTTTTGTPAYSARVLDQLPANLSYVSSSGTGWTCTTAANADGTLVTCNFIGTIAASVGTAAVQITVTPTNNLSVTNYAAVDPAGGTTPPTPTACTAANTPSAGCAAPVTSAVSTTVSGTVYGDANHNASLDSGETGTGEASLYVKLIPSSGSMCSGPATAAAAVTADTGAYSLTGLAPGNYCLILDNNNTLVDITPAVPADWIGTQNASGVIQLSVTGAPSSPRNFGLFKGSRLSGIVFADTGIGAGASANNGVKDGSEAGLASITVNASATGMTGVSASTAGDGSYTLWLPFSASGMVTIAPVVPSAYLSVGGLPGTTTMANGAYSRPNVTYTAPAVAGQSYTGVDFGLVPPNTLAPNGAQMAQPGTVVFYAHTFKAGSGGQVTFSVANTATPSGLPWTQVLYRDTSCTGALDTAAVQITAPLAVLADSTLCLIVKQFVPAAAAIGAGNATTLSASFSYTGASPALSRTLSATDVTTVDEPGALALIKRVSNLTQRGPGGLTVNANPGETLQYLLTAVNNGSEPLSLLVINDATPAFTTFYSAACPATMTNGLTACSLTQQPAVGAVGSVQWTFTGSLAPSAQFSVSYEVKVNN